MSTRTARTTYGAGLTTGERRQWNREADAILARRAADSREQITARRAADLSDEQIAEAVAAMQITDAARAALLRQIADRNPGARFVVAGFIRRREREAHEAAMVAQMEATHPGSSWAYTWNRDGSRILVSIPHD